MKRIHITGSPRSGTTLMLEMMATGFAFDVVGKHEISALADLPEPHPGAVACTKNPSEWAIVPGLLACDPDRWFICMVRDPRDVVVSIHRMRPEVYWTNLRLWRLAWGAIQNCRDHERLLVVRYEDLVRHPDQVQEAIAARLPFLNQVLPFSRFHQGSRPSSQSVQAMNGLRPVADASVGAWQQHKARLAGQLALHGSISEVLIDLGYEVDDRWLEQLTGVLPDTSPGHWAEFVSDQQRQASLHGLEQALGEYRRKHRLP